jgi:lauroyl/myristoyl acyltransferase
MPKYRPKHVVEYVCLRALSGLLNALPYRAALAFAWLLAALAFCTARSRMRETRRRIRLVFGESLPARAVRHIAWISCRNLFFNGVEMLRAHRLDSKWLARSCDCAAAVQAVRSALAGGRGAVAAVPHMGNWEVMAIVCRLHNLPIFGIAGRQNNPLTNNYLNRLRAGVAAPAVERGSDAMRAVLQRLMAGQFMAILPDVRMRGPGVLVPFLGGKANLGPGMALFARRAGVPILTGYSRRVGWTRHVFQMFPPVHPDNSLDKGEDVVRMTALVMKHIEDAIRLEPEQWFWFNSRWVLDPL